MDAISPKPSYVAASAAGTGVMLLAMYRRAHVPTATQGEYIALLMCGVGIGAGLTAAAIHAARARAVPDVPPTPPPPPPPPDDGLEDWEREAMRTSDVDDMGNDEPVEPDAPAEGSGSPQDTCVTEEEVKAVANPGTFCILDPLAVPELVPQDRGAPQARVPARSQWPVETTAAGRLVTSYLSASGWRGYSGRAFGAKRKADDGTVRRHAGVDVWANEHDLVVAPQDGRVIAVLPFYRGTWAVYVRTADDQVINLGEVANVSYREFGIRPGMEVKQGQPVARIGRMHKDTMLHVEVYDATGATDDEMVKLIRAKHFQWLGDEPAPERLMDPSPYLLVAASRTWRSEQKTS